MGSCCTTTNERLENELNTNPTTRADLKSGTTPGQAQDESYAAITLQKHFRGLMTRREIKAKYGFEAHTHLMGRDGQTFTQSDAQVQEARRLVMQIRASLEPFDYDPKP